MSTKEEAKEIALEYLEKSNIPDGESIKIEDKIYKWAVTTKGSNGKYLIEISKSNSTVIKFENL